MKTDPTLPANAQIVGGATHGGCGTAIGLDATLIVYNGANEILAHINIAAIPSMLDALNESAKHLYTVQDISRAREKAEQALAAAKPRKTF